MEEVEMILESTKKDIIFLMHNYSTIGKNMYFISDMYYEQYLDVEDEYYSTSSTDFLTRNKLLFLLNELTIDVHAELENIKQWKNVIEYHRDNQSYKYALHLSELKRERYKRWPVA